MFFKLLNAEQVKAAEDKTKADKKKRKVLKKEVRRLSSDSVITKLREDLELSKQRAQHFEKEYFDLKRSLIFQADQELRSELYEIERQLKVKDDEIEKYSYEYGCLSSQFQELNKVNEELKSKVLQYSTIITDELTADEVNDQVNQLLKEKP